MNKISVWIIPALLVLVSCQRNPLKVDISGIDDELTIVRYEQELMNKGTMPGKEDLLRLRETYPEFTDLFTEHIIRTGNLRDEGAVEGMHAFLTDTMISSAYAMAEQTFRDFDPVRKKLAAAFRHYRYYFPSGSLPAIYTCISGFNESAFVAEGLIGISLDKYLGSGTAYYPLLGFPRYKQRRMTPDMIPSDAMYVWGMGEFDHGGKAVTLLDHMIFQGKLMYFTEAMMPAEHDTLITGFTPAQLTWCRNNESQMWTWLVEHELLYSTKKMDIVRYINDGPHTNGFPSESPARTGAWLGRQIIRQYMKRNKEVTLDQLMRNHNFQEILNGAAYLP